MKLENLEVSNISNAIRAMRNQSRDWHKSFNIRGITKFENAERLAHNNGISITDIIYYQDNIHNCDVYVMDPVDMELARELLDKEEFNHLKQIFVSMDITAPLYWWFDFLAEKTDSTYVNFENLEKTYCEKMGKTPEAFSAGLKKLPLDFELMGTITMTYNDCRILYENYFKLLGHNGFDKEWLWFLRRIMGLPYANYLFL